MSVAVEIAVQDVAGTEVAARAGAHRVELCADLHLGGLTPPAALVEEAVARAAALVAAGEARATFDVHVLVRHRGAADVDPADPSEFVVGPEDLEVLADHAARSVDAGAAGVVLGALTADGALDTAALATLRDAALLRAGASLRGLTLSCHRAVDALPDRAARVEAVRSLLGLGFHRVLSSGGALRALDGAEDLAAMVVAGEGVLDVAAGAGVRPGHLAELVRATGVTDVHLSARRAVGSPREPGAPATDTDPAVVTAALDAAGAL